VQMWEWIPVHGSHTISLRRNKCPKRTPKTANGAMTWPASKEDLISKYKKQFFVFIESIDFDNLKV
jgi:hypothetical protein